MDLNVFLCRGSCDCLKCFLTSYDATRRQKRRQKRRQFMYDFKKISKISIFCHLKMANIWISMFSYVDNLFLRFLRLFNVYMTSYDATQRKKRRQFLRMYDLKKISQNWSICYLKMANIWISKFSMYKSVFEVPVIV